MSLIDGQFGALTVLRVNCEAAFEGYGVVVLIGLAGEDEVLFRRQLAVETVHAEVDTVALLDRREEQLRLAYRHRVDRTDGLFPLNAIDLSMHLLCSTA